MGVCLLIHVGIKVNPYEEKGPQVSMNESDSGVIEAFPAEIQ